MVFISLYLLKSCAYVIAFYIPFILILKRTTFFTLNRIYLVAGLLLSFILPLYTAAATVMVYTPVDFPFMEPMVTQAESAISRVSQPSDSFSIVAGLMIIYLAGIIFRLIVLSLSISSIIKLKQQGEVSAYQNVKIVKVNTAVPFSFFNYVFLPGASAKPGILEHEAAHVRQYHWVDLLIVELVSILLWFNPVMIFYKRCLKQQHEYLADRSTIKSGIDIAEFLMCIKHQVELAIPVPLVSEFYFQSIKSRINMLTKKRTSLYGLAMYTIVLPILISLLMAFSARKSFLDINHDKTVSGQKSISLSLPIDKTNSYLLESGFGERLHPVLGVMRLHTGIDLMAEEGVPVISAAEGVVIKAQMEGAWGNLVIIQHDETYSTSYSHLKSMNVKAGDKVKTEQLIGLVGNTGLSTKYHLHFELRKKGVAIDPISYLPKMK
jgi:hypothetical protein